jgi:hypothetical protein
MIKDIFKGTKTTCYYTDANIYRYIDMMVIIFKVF